MSAERIAEAGGWEMPDAPLTVTDGLPPGWAAFTAAGPRCLKPEWLAYEPGRLPGPLRTFTLHRAGRPVVGTVGTVLDTVTARRFADPYRLLHDGPPGRPEPARPWAGLAPEDVLPSVLLMSPEYETAVAGPGAGDPAEVAAFVDALLRWATAAGARSVVVPYLTPASRLLADALAAQGFDTVPLGGCQVLSVDWKDPDGYVAGLPSRRQRKNVGRELRRFAELPVRIEVRTLGTDEPELVELMMAHARRYGTPQHEEGARQLFRRVLDCFGAERTLLATATHEGTMTAFSLFLRDGETLVGSVAGTRYDAPYASESHFQVLFYEIAGRAPLLGVREVVYGMGDDVTKAQRGCEPVELRTAFRRLTAT
ncbi:GNAT family N-acetyltransferase [Micromonospora sp. NPDC007271]|uniref:GNAT family N-acetyltransferase n=1 Tax=Micromonospora sp. NPDC007271 TaxID=3154587 RepID=UPI0033EDE736